MAWTAAATGAEMAAAAGATCAGAATDTLAAATRAGAAEAPDSGAEAASPTADDGTVDVHQATSAPATSAHAIARNPIDGPQRSCCGLTRDGLSTGRPRLTRQGAAVLEVDTFQPMRSWPYWFQIGLLPLANEV